MSVYTLITVVVIVAGLAVLAVAVYTCVQIVRATEDE